MNAQAARKFLKDNEIRYILAQFVDNSFIQRVQQEMKK